MPYFPEPAKPDTSLPRWGETTASWLRRSTTKRAVAVRDFLNRSLACFRGPHARSLAKRLDHEWNACLFEIVVGRYLQTLGAEIVAEPLGTNGKRVDFVATFPDGVVSVECVSKRFNQEAQREMDRHSNMGVMLDEVGPHKWAIVFRRLPKANSPDEFRPYIEQAQGWYQTLPEAVEDGPRLTFEWTGDSGDIQLVALPFPKGTRANHMGPAVARYHDSILRLKDALIDSGKRKQAIGAPKPVFLAIDCPFGGPRAEDFDQALFGRTVDHRGWDLNETVGESFDPDGLLVTDKAIPFAGVWAFLNLSLAGAADPVLYLNPYQRWKLPAAVAAHEQRVWTSRIDRSPRTREASINSIGFVKFPEDDDD